MRRRILILAALGLTSAADGQPERPLFWRFRGFGMDLVQCRLVKSRVQNCVFLSGSGLDGVMEAVHRATRGREVAE